MYEDLIKRYKKQKIKEENLYKLGWELGYNKALKDMRKELLDNDKRKSISKENTQKLR